MIRGREDQEGHSERGAALIVALVLMLAIGIAVVAVTNFSIGSATTNYNLTNQRAVVANSEGALNVAIGNLRTQYSPTGSGGNLSISQGCLPTGMSSYPPSKGPASSGSKMTVFCTGAFYPDKVPTRVISFYVCPASATACTASSSNLTASATVAYDDVDPNVAETTSACVSTCGVSLSVTLWNVVGADT